MTNVLLKFQDYFNTRSAFNTALLLDAGVFYLLMPAITAAYIPYNTDVRLLTHQNKATATSTTGASPFFVHVYASLWVPARGIYAVLVTIQDYYPNGIDIGYIYVTDVFAHNRPPDL